MRLQNVSKIVRETCHVAINANTDASSAKKVTRIAMKKLKQNSIVGIFVLTSVI